MAWSTTTCRGITCTASTEAWSISSRERHWSPTYCGALPPANEVLTASQIPGPLSEVTAGVRLAGALPRGFDYEIEIDKQTGSLGARSIHAWAGYWSLGKTF